MAKSKNNRPPRSFRTFQSLLRLSTLCLPLLCNRSSFSQEIFKEQKQQLLELAQQLQDPKILGFLPPPLWNYWDAEAGIQSRPFSPVLSIPMFHNSAP
ncbi:hypothetical protein ACFX12_039723 [Malus domestica]